MKRKHCPYKPGSVLTRLSASAIYLLHISQCVSSVLPSIVCRAGNPQTMVYMNLQPPDGTARRSPAGWWSLTHTFSPLPRYSQFFLQAQEHLSRGGHSLLPYPAVANCFYFQKWSALCCPDFPPVFPYEKTSGRPEQCFQTAKVLIFI